MTDKLKTFYDRSPVVAQNLMLTAFSFHLHLKRYGGNYRKYEELFEKYQWMSRDELVEYQNERLEKIIRHAYETVPYYKDTFNEIKLQPEDIKGVDDLHKAPLLRKEDFKFNPQRLYSRSFGPRQLIKGHTSGTTGTPLDIWYDRDTVHVAYAALARHYRWAGCRLGMGGDRIAVARGNVVVPIETRTPPYWRHNWTHNQLLLSSFHMSINNLDHYIRALEHFRPVVIDGYPSTLYILAKYLRNAGRIFPLKAAITSSETLYDFQREVIEDSFQCRVFDYYALAERTVFASECESHFKHHLSMEYGISEITDDGGDRLPAGENGLLVGTSLHNMGMPLIRYVTNDRTSISDERCPCGRDLELMADVTTKAEDTLTLRDGRLISPSVLTHPFKPLHSIQESQIVQKDYDHIVVRIVKGSDYTDADTLHLVGELQGRLGQDVFIDVQFTDALDRTGSGKFRWVISEVELGV